ncbi:MAG: LPS export ABC transporter periplasmic protein LptC [candidate division KSB1 bacterium]|jgi:LPS export ABC transporter protein LptC|nr:LPS export ABC transporter periplasmic protein LptC [candidate division KSB1 bacterium]
MRFALYFIIVLMMFSCGGNDEAPVKNTGKNLFPDQEGWNSTLKATTNGITTAIIEYGHMERFNKKKIVNFSDGVSVDFFDENGLHTSKLTSKKGRLDEKNNVVEAFENVVVVSDSGITLQTEKIWWNNNIRKVISDRFVTITTAENDTLYGVGFESDETLTNWILNEPRGKTDRGVKLDLETEADSDSVDTD